MSLFAQMVRLEADPELYSKDLNTTPRLSCARFCYPHQVSFLAPDA